jgi:polyisoprenoid-binding protein YceI
MSVPALSVLAPLLATSGCADPGKDKAAAVVVDAPAAGVTPAAPTATPAPPTGPAQVDPAAGTRIPAVGQIGFIGAKVTKSHEGAFALHSSVFQMRGDTLAAVSIEVMVSSLKTDSAKLDGHLASPDFFDVANIPTATFKSTEIRPGAPAATALVGATHTAIGDLTIHGVTQHIEVPVIVDVQPDHVAARTEFSIKRQDFGITYPGKADDLIADNVVIKVDLNAIR